MKTVINPARVDFVTLRLFCRVVQTGSITKGATQCHLALSAASRRLSDFETAAGTPLLERSVQGVTVTPAGHVAVQHAMRLLQGFELFGTELAEFSEGYRGHVRLWANMSALTEFLPVVLWNFMELQPKIRVDIEEQLSGDIVRALLDGLADVGVFAEGPATHGLIVLPFRDDELVLLCARSHPLARKEQVAFSECLTYDFVGLNRGSSLLELISKAAAEEDNPLRVRVQVRSFDAMSQMVAARLGIGILPLAACQGMLESRGLCAIPLTDAWARRRLWLGHSADRPPSAAAQVLLAHLRAPAA